MVAPGAGALVTWGAGPEKTAPASDLTLPGAVERGRNQTVTVIIPRQLSSVNPDPVPCAHAVDGVLAQFVDRLPRRPYCSNDLATGLVVRDRATATGMKYLQHNPPGVVCHLVVDCDYPGAALAADDVNLPMPTATVENPDNKHAHHIYTLKVPAASEKPQRFARAMREALRVALGGDPAFTGLIGKNPLSSAWSTQWGPKLYQLDELAEYMPKVKRAALPGRWSADYADRGRNCRMFEMLRHIAYAEVGTMLTESALALQLSLVADQANGALSDPLPHRELSAVVRSISKWVWARRTTITGRRGGRVRLLLPRDMTTPDRLKAGAAYTARRKSERTAAKIAAARETLKASGERATVAAICRLAGITRRHFYRVPQT